MAKSKLARRARKLRNLKALGVTCFNIEVVNKQHGEALKRAFIKAGYSWDTCPIFGVWRQGVSHVLCYDNSGNYKAGHNTAFFNHDGDYQCVKL
jgi:N-methylhydantoinase A/oxoprolinase/acetone carboxylase beta subunit